MYFALSSSGVGKVFLSLKVGKGAFHGLLHVLDSPIDYRSWRSLVSVGAILLTTLSFCAPLAWLSTIAHSNGGHIPCVAYAVAYFESYPSLLRVKKEVTRAANGEHKSIMMFTDQPFLFLPPFDIEIYRST